MKERPTISVVIVAHDSLSDLRHSLPPLIDQLGEEDELIVVDSGSGDGVEHRLIQIAPAAKLITAGGNVGFATGANLGASAASGDLIVLLNPDAVVQHAWSEAIRRPWGGRWTAWMALVTMESGNTINTSGGVIHFTGVAWAGQVGKHISTAPVEPRAVGFASGACLAVPADDWHRLGGFPDCYFMYCEDVDLSLRVRLTGGDVAVIPDARVIHRYNFDKGPQKWRMLERNRWATIIRCYPGLLLVVLLPALFGAELAIWMAALRGRWAAMKALAACDVLRAMPRLLSERREIQRHRTVDALSFSAALTAKLDSPYLDTAGSGGGADRILAAYWAVVRRFLALGRRCRGR